MADAMWAQPKFKGKLSIVHAGCAVQLACESDQSGIKNTSGKTRSGSRHIRYDAQKQPVKKEAEQKLHIF